MNKRAVIDALVEVAPPILLDHFRPDCCIAATHHGQEVLRYFGVDSKPVKTAAMVGNETWRAWFESLIARGLRPGDEPMPEGSWSVGIDIEADGGYAGHLVLLADGKLVDLSLGQLSRPAKQMTLPDAAAFNLSDSWETNGDTGYLLEEVEGERCALIYRRLPERDWQRTPDWKRKPFLAGQIIRAIRDELCYRDGESKQVLVQD